SAERGDTATLATGGGRMPMPPLPSRGELIYHASHAIFACAQNAHNAHCALCSARSAQPRAQAAHITHTCLETCAFCARARRWSALSSVLCVPALSASPPGGAPSTAWPEAPSCHGFSRPSLAEPDVIDAADLAGDDLVAGAVDGASERHPLGLLLDRLGLAGREVRLVELGLDQPDLERPDQWAVGERPDLLAAVDEQVHDGAT